MNTNQKSTAKKLTIKKETLRKLGEEDLSKVVGGSGTTGTHGTCVCTEHSCETYSSCTFIACCRW